MNIDKPKGIIDGFDEDFSRIAREFSEQYAELKLTDFFSYWIDNKLDLLFVNRFDPRELLEAIDEMNKLLVTKLAGDNDIEWVVALYMLMCIYKKQPQRQRRSLRMTMDEFISIDQLVPKRGCNAPFAWRCLKNSNAIHIVEEKECYGPHLLKKGGKKNQDLTEIDYLQILKDDTKIMIEEQMKLIDEMESYHMAYQNVLSSLDMENRMDHLNEVKETLNKLKKLAE